MLATKEMNNSEEAKIKDLKEMMAVCAERVGNYTMAQDLFMEVFIYRYNISKFGATWIIPSTGIILNGIWGLFNYKTTYTHLHGLVPTIISRKDYSTGQNAKTTNFWWLTHLKQ